MCNKCRSSQPDTGLNYDAITDTSCVLLLLCLPAPLLQMSVRVTFDRGDVEHFIAEAVKLNDAGTTNYQTIVAGGAICFSTKHGLDVSVGGAFFWDWDRL